MSCSIRKQLEKLNIHLICAAENSAKIAHVLIIWFLVWALEHPQLTFEIRCCVPVGARREATRRIYCFTPSESFPTGCNLAQKVLRMQFLFEFNYVHLICAIYLLT